MAQKEEFEMRKIKRILCKKSISSIGKCLVAFAILFANAPCISLSGTISLEASNYQLGDVNKDNLVNALDALLVLKSSAKICELDDYQKNVADVNKDGITNTDDALQILKVAAKLDVYKINVNLSVNQEYTIDRIFDSGKFVWSYEVVKGKGIFVEKTIKELPIDSAPGDTPEQVYTICANQPGTYNLLMKLVSVSDEKDILEERMYIIQVN